MQIDRTESDGWLSNAYLIVGDDERTAVLVDGNGNPEPLLRTIDERRLSVELILLTHHHADHVVLDPYAHIDAPVLSHSWTADALASGVVDQTVMDGEVLTVGGCLRIEALHTPGHDAGHLAYLVNDTDVLTADVLFKGTVGGTRAPGATGFDDLRRSVERLMTLPDGTRVHPGHTVSTTIGTERETNPFVRAFGEAAPHPEPCLVVGEPADLLLWGPDYDGTNKAWVRLGDGALHIVGGSQVTRSSSARYLV